MDLSGEAEQEAQCIIDGGEEGVWRGVSRVGNAEPRRRRGFGRQNEWTDPRRLRFVMAYEIGQMEQVATTGVLGVGCISDDNGGDAFD